MKENISLTIVVPAFNEEDTLEAIIQKIFELRKKNPYLKLETIIVDDGSSDKTFYVSRSLINKFPSLNINVVRHATNMGPGAALKTGNSLATTDFVTYVPADGQFDVSELRRFIKEIKNCDLVIGYRTSRPSDSIFRRILSQIFAHVIKAMFQVNVRDFNWVYLYRRSAFRNIKIRSNGFFISSEMIAKSFKKGLRIKEIPSKLYPRKMGKSGNLRPRGISQAIIEMFKVWLEVKWN